MLPSYSLVEVRLRYFHLQVPSVSQASSQQEEGSLFLRNVGELLLDVTSQKRVSLHSHLCETSNPAILVL
jgi:hypothetical protein